MSVAIQPSSQAAEADPQPRKLKGTAKAAVLFLCLGEKAGSDLMRRLDMASIEQITRAMTRLGAIPAAVVEEVLSEFIGRAIEGSTSVTGSPASAVALLRSFMPEDEANKILRNAGSAGSDVWRRFGTLNESVIANYVRGEHDQTVAAIMSNIEPAVAAKVLPLLGPERMADVAERMIRMEPMSIEVMRQLEETLRGEIVSEGVSSSSAETQRRLADMFNHLDIGAFENLSGVLEERVPEPFRVIKQSMFVFDDLGRLDSQDLARVLREMEGDRVPLALRGARKALCDLMLSVLPARSRQMLLDEMEAMGTVKGRDVRQAQSDIVEVAKGLAEAGVITLPVQGDDMDDIYE